jgi:mediator of replication checkpoint protein 1
MKRRQFAKMQKALFADERISKVAEDPRKKAFLQTIEDRGSDDDMDFMFEQPAVASKEDDTDREASAIPDSQPSVVPRLPGPQRRTRGPAGGKKPANISEVRASLSNLLQETHAEAAVIPATDMAGSNSEEEQGVNTDKENLEPLRRRRTDSSSGSIVDRMTLKRTGSSLSTSEPNTAASRRGRLAFASGNGTGSSFKAPTLLRRATANSLISNGSTGSTTSSTTDNSSAFGEEAKIRKGSGKRSGVNYSARDSDRRSAALAESEKRREARKWKGAEGRGRMIGGLLGGGKFE